MSDRQNQEVLDWLQGHPTVTSQSLSRVFSLSLPKARSLLLEAVDLLGKDQFQLIYCLQKPDFQGQSYELISSAGLMDVDSEDMVLFGVQKKKEDGKSLHRTELALMNLTLEQGSSTAKSAGNCGIQPLEQRMRELLPHRKKASPAVLKTPPKVIGKKPQVFKPASKPQSTLNQASFPTVVSEAPVSLVEAKSVEAKKEETHVKFTEAPDHSERPIKRRSTPHPSKHAKAPADTLNELMKSSLYTVEEDDAEVTPAVSLKRKLSEEEEKPEKKGKTYVKPKEEPQSQAPTEGVKRVKVTQTKTYLDEKGYIVSKDVVEDQLVKVQSLPSKPVLGAGVANKKGKQTGIGAFFQKK